jgi:endonuclease/exonuclease/phosphatase (EEP) superfamily protein YafD
MTLVTGAVGLAIGRFGAYCDACDLTNIGYSAWLILAIFGIVIVIACKAASPSHIILAALLVAAMGYRSYVPAPQPCANTTIQNKWKIVSFNAWTDNKSPTLSASWIRRQKPDIVVLVEAKGRSAILPDLLARDLPYQASCALRIPCSTMILSRVRPSQVIFFARGDVENRKVLSAFAMRFAENDNAGATVVAVHLSRPLPLGRQRVELASLQERLVKFDTAKLIVAGDFNSTAHNTAFTDFARALALGEASPGLTWPTTAVHAGAPSVVTIDHILTGRSFGVVDVRTGPMVGSDHRPVVATLCGR